MHPGLNIPLTRENTLDIKYGCSKQTHPNARAFRNFLSRSIQARRGGTSLFSYSLSSSVSFSRCDDNDSAEREQSSSIRLLMRVIIEPGSPVLIMRFRICRSENEHPRRANTAPSLCSGGHACMRACVRASVRSHARVPERVNAYYANISA